MGKMTIDNIPDEDLAGLKYLAARNNRSAEAEVRMAIAVLVRSAKQGLGSRLHEAYGGAIDAEFGFERDRTGYRQDDPLSVDVADRQEAK